VLFDATCTTGKSISVPTKWVEVVGEHVHGDRGDDLDDLLNAYTAARSVATSLVGR
jgi:hypothetical protein